MLYNDNLRVDWTGSEQVFQVINLVGLLPQLEIFASSGRCCVIRRRARDVYLGMCPIKMMPTILM